MKTILQWLRSRWADVRDAMEEDCQARAALEEDK